MSNIDVFFTSVFDIGYSRFSIGLLNLMTLLLEATQHPIKGSTYGAKNVHFIFFYKQVAPMGHSFSDAYLKWIITLVLIYQQ